MSKYAFDDDKKQLYCALIILDAIVDKGYQFDQNSDDILLDPIINRMIEKELVTDQLEVTEKGQELLDNFYQRYQEFLRLYDIYCAVDLEAGEFAFKNILDMTVDEFQVILKDSRWDDVRVAVCEFKKIDPMQMVFLSFLREGRVELVKGWQTLLLKGAIWADITKICETAITLEQLSFEDQIKNIIESGSTLLKDLLHREKEMKESELRSIEQGDEETITTVTEEVTVIDEDIAYYDQYFYDPYYVSPCWGYYYYTPFWW